MSIEKIYKISGFVLAIAAIIVAGYFLLQRSRGVNPPTVSMPLKNTEIIEFCNKETDCVVVAGKNCCECPRAISRDYLDYWNTLEYKRCSDPAPLCSPCLSPEMQRAVCQNNKCETRQK